MPTPPTEGRLLRRGFRTIAAMVRLRSRTFAVAVSGAAVFAVATVASSWALGRVTDDVVVPRFRDGHVATGTVVAGLGLVVAIGLLKAAGIVVRRVAAVMTASGVAADLRAAVVRRYQRVPYAFHRRTPTGELLARASSDVDAAIEVLNPLPYSTGVVVILVLSIGWMVATDPWLAVIGLVVFPVVLAGNLLYQRVVEGPVAAAQVAIGDLTAVAHESFDGALIVKALGAEGLESQRFARAAERVRDAKVRAARLRATFDALLDAIPTMGTLLLLPVGAWRVDSGDITTGTVVAFVSLFQLLVFPLRLFGYLLGELPRSVVAHDRIQGALAVPVAAPRRRLDPAGGAGAVEVEGLTFAHEPGIDVLRDVSFRVEPGRTVAVVGATGSGKSTLLLLLAGLLEPEGGTIRLGGAELAMAFQEPFLFADSIGENVLLGGAGERLDPVLALAGADRFVAALPAGPDTVVGERGATLSGGQRQRVALARALARRPQLLLLDDATSAVDPTTEGRILAALAHELAGTTTIVVASRPATIALADEVLYLEAGRLVDHAPHATLVERHPHYRRLVQAYELDRADRGEDQ